MANCQDIFGYDSKAFVVMPAEIISSGITKEPEVSESGHWIFYQRQMVSSPENLVAKKGAEDFVWFAYNRSTKVNTRLALPKTASHIVFMGDDQTIYFEDKASEKASFYNIKSGVITPVPVADDYELSYFGEKEYAPFLIFNKDTHVVFVYPNGKQSSFTHKVSLAIQAPIGADAQNLYFVGTVVKSNPTKVGRVSVNRQTGVVEFVEWNQDEMDKFFEGVKDDEEDFDLQFQANLTYISIPEFSPVNKTIIPRSGKLCLGHDVLLSSKNLVAVYQDSGALLIREIKVIDPKLAIKGVEDAVKEKIIKDAKQIAIAFLLFSADNDDVMPTQEGWSEGLVPYAKDRELLKKFTYTFKGGDISKLDESKVEIGFIVGLGGRAVAYLDGAVKWIPNP